MILIFLYGAYRVRRMWNKPVCENSLEQLVSHGVVESSFVSGAFQKCLSCLTQDDKWRSQHTASLSSTL